MAIGQFEAISTSEIGFLGKRFIVYLALAHRECHAELKQHMASKDGYILHMDGTCEGDSPQLFSCIDEISKFVLGNRKMPTEDSQHIIPLENAAFWRAGQAQFIHEAIAEDADWAEVVDHLDAQLRH